MAIKLKLELRGTKILRVISVPPGLTLFDLNGVIQEMFGFENDHLWNFQSKDGREWNTGCNPFGERLNMDMRGILDPDDYCIEDVLSAAKARLLYSYDYGDGWEIAVTRMADTKDDEVACIETAGTNAMEDVGGVYGLEEFTKLLKNCTIQSEDEITDDTDFRIADWGYDDPAEREAFLKGPTKEELTEILRKKVQWRLAAHKKREEAEARAQLFKGIGRNAPCPCGSGLKYKKCCGK